MTNHEKPAISGNHQIHHQIHQLSIGLSPAMSCPAAVAISGVVTRLELRVERSFSVLQRCLEGLRLCDISSQARAAAGGSGQRHLGVVNDDERRWLT